MSHFIPKAITPKTIKEKSGPSNAAICWEVMDEKVSTQ